MVHATRQEFSQTPRRDVSAKAATERLQRPKGDVTERQVLSPHFLPSDFSFLDILSPCLKILLSGTCSVLIRQRI